MATKLFVGGLPYAVTSEELRTTFEAVGTVVSADVIFDKYSGQSKGFGFVEMATDEDTQRAIEQLNDTEIGGRKISVGEARPQERRERPPRSGGFGGGDDRRGGGGGNRDGGFQRGGGRRY